MWWQIISRARDTAFLFIPTPVFFTVVFYTRSVELALAVGYMTGLALLRIKNFTEDLHLSAIDKKFDAQKKKPFICKSNQIKIIDSSPLTIQAVSEPLAQVRDHYLAMQLKVYRDDAEKFIVGLGERIRNNTYFAVVAVLFLSIRMVPQIQSSTVVPGDHRGFDLSALIPFDSSTLIVTLAVMALQILNLLKPLWVYRERNKSAA